MLSTVSVRAVRLWQTCWMMTAKEAYALGWHTSQRGLKNEDVLLDGVKETRTVLDNECPPEILDDDLLYAAWKRGYDEGCQANFDRKYPSAGA